MSETTILKGELREKLGTGPARELRRNSLIPGTVYGVGRSPLSISIEEKEVTKLYRRHGFTTTVIELNISGSTYKVLPKAVDLHPITDLVRHVDFIFLAESGQQVVDVPMMFEGKERSLGVKRGGFFNIIHRKIKLYCPVSNIPQHVIIDVTNMGVGNSLRAYKIDLPEGCSLFSKNDYVIASITGRGGKGEETETSEA